MGTLAYVDRTPGKRPVGSLSDDISILFGTFTFSTSYATGGEALDLTARPDIREVVMLIPVSQGGYLFRYDAAAKKLMAFYGNYDAADGPLIELPATTNISAVGAIPFIAFVR